MSKSELRTFNYNGFEWGYDEHGYHCYVKKTCNGYLVARVKSSDLIDESYRFMFDNNLSH